MSKFLGLDYGTKRIGLAMADDEMRLASPLGIIENKSPSFVVEELEKIIKDEEVKKIIVGLPISLEGEKKKGELLREILDFVACLKNKLGVIVETEDERFSSEQAKSLMMGLGRKRADKDTVAAMIILQSYLDRESRKQKAEIKLSF